MSYELLQTGNKVNFNIKTNIIKSTFRGVTVQGIVTADVAQQISDVKSLHKQVKPYITGLPDGHDDYNYVIVKMDNGQRVVVGKPWIEATSITLSSRRAYTLILDDVEQDQVELIRQVLLARGITIRSFTAY